MPGQDTVKAKEMAEAHFAICNLDGKDTAKFRSRRAFAPLRPCIIFLSA